MAGVSANFSLVMELPGESKDVSSGLDCGLAASQSGIGVNCVGNEWLVPI